MISYLLGSALIVDDDPEFLNTVQLMLRRSGFGHTVAAGDGFTALEYLKHRRFDVIVSDWSMPGMNGVELLIRVRQNTSTSNVPFILMTASLAEAPWRGAIEHGATEFLLKPFTLEELGAACQLCRGLKAFEAGNVTPLQTRMRRRAYRV